MRGTCRARCQGLAGIAALSLIPATILGTGTATANAATGKAASSGVADFPVRLTPGPGNISTTFTTAQQRATLRYWTRSREESARPLPLPIAGGSAPPARMELAGNPPGTPLIVHPAKPGAAFSAALMHRQLSHPGGPPITQHFYPAPFTRFSLNPADYAAYPNSAHGKLFFRIIGPGVDEPSECSGTVVTSRGRSLVETAGHCVFNPDKPHVWYSDVEFVPAYQNGSAPFGRFPAAALWTKLAWFKRQDSRDDRGFIVLGRNSNGQLIQDSTGAEGIALNQGYQQNVLSLGYPAERPFNGQTEYACLSTFEELTTSIGETGAAPWSIGCDMTGGSSGGGWVIDYGPAGGYVNGHNSYSPIVDGKVRDLEMATPYFGNSELSLYKCAAGDMRKEHNLC